MSRLDTPFTRDAGVSVPVICGPMYPCSNPELVAAVSQAGGLGVLQPVSLTYVFGFEFREGVQRIRELTDRPIGMNCLIEASSQRYLERMERWLDIALEEGVRFFVTSLGKPDWVVQRVHAVGGHVYHDVTERKWAQKAVDGGVDGLIAVNRRAGGHPGPLDPAALLDAVGDLGLPVVAAGGVATPDQVSEMLALGYAGVQMGTRFIATPECAASEDYKQAIVEADADDIVWTERITGVPVAVLDTPFVRAVGTRAGPLARLLLRGRKTRHWMRSWYALRSLARLKRSSIGRGRDDYWQAGRSVDGIDALLPAGEVVRRCAERLDGPA
ncbi:nitronate monooxygenase [Gemmatimonadota bacterium DH-20]|uniref:Nitronate monooxygenase n=1 Tax=Gaopeijia maritima TaxID=3119007 RepID=A0ABU9E6W8_9BACT